MQAWSDYGLTVIGIGRGKEEHRGCDYNMRMDDSRPALLMIVAEVSMTGSRGAVGSAIAEVCRDRQPGFLMSGQRPTRRPPTPSWPTVSVRRDDQVSDPRATGGACLHGSALEQRGSSKPVRHKSSPAERAGGHVGLLTTRDASDPLASTGDVRDFHVRDSMRKCQTAGGWEENNRDGGAGMAGLLG